MSRATDTGTERVHDDSVDRRLYQLLDTLLAMRIDFGHEVAAQAGAEPPDPQRMQDIRTLLDVAIASTKEIIGAVARPPDL